MRRDVVLALVGEPTSVLAEEPNARLLAAAVMETLVVRDSRDELSPRLAQAIPTLANGGLRWLVDEDSVSGQLVADFTLRPDVRWQDRRPITADDVRFAFAQDRSTPAGTERRYRADRIERVEVVAERTARVYYRKGERWPDYALGPRVLPRHVLGGASEERRAAYERSPLHAGPFSVAAWIPGFGVTLAANPDYVLGPPSLGRIEVRFLRDRAAVLDALKRGEVDVAPSPALEADLALVLDQLADGTERSGLQTYYSATESIEALRFGPRFGEASVRRAIELAIDRTRIADIVFAGRARVPSSYLVAPSREALTLGAAPRVDRELSRALLGSAGYRPGGFGILERDGERLIATLVVADGSAARIDAARLVASDLAAIGIAVEVLARTAAEVDAAIERSAFELALVAESGADPFSATDRYRGRAGTWFDALAVTARGAGETDQRALYGELQRVWAEVRPAIPLYQRLAVDVAPRDLAGIRPSPAGAPLTWNAGLWGFARAR
ncbi:MAG: hypothetical protein HY071_05635 [Chloroflexi bacterium]|nr:hypothetical protein [Chloroflexota bacterium]